MTISKTDFQYDGQGNEIQAKVYPSYSTDGEKEVIQNDYTYNSLEIGRASCRERV